MAYDAEMARIGESLRQRRRTLGITQAELAHAAAVATRDVQRYEAGASSPGAPSFMRLLSALGLKIGDGEVAAPRAVNAELRDLRLELLQLRELLAPGGSAAISLIEEIIARLLNDAEALPADHLATLTAGLRSVGVRACQAADLLDARSEGRAAK